MNNAISVFRSPPVLCGRRRRRSWELVLRAGLTRGDLSARSSAPVVSAQSIRAHACASTLSRDASVVISGVLLNWHTRVTTRFVEEEGKKKQKPLYFFQENKNKNKTKRAI